jgi:magnesium transporter
MTDARGVHALVEAALDRHPEETARELERVPLDEVVELLLRHPEPDRWLRVLQSLSFERSTRLLESIPTERARDLLEAMEPPFAAKLLSRMEDEASARLLESLAPVTRSELTELLTYPADTAGRIMDPRVMAFPPSATTGEVIHRLRFVTWKRFFEIFVVGPTGELSGSVPLQAVAVAPPETELGDLMRPPVAWVEALAPLEEVVELLGERKLAVLPVIDRQGHLLGAIRYEALLTAQQEEASADLLTMVGASREERALSRVSFAVKKRLPWLQINLGTAFLAAAVVGLFEETIARTTALAVLLPVVAGQSGNTGAQALAVVMRGLALREIRLRQWNRVLLKELGVGVLNGVAIAASTSFFVYLWSQSVGLAAIIGLSMVISMAIAGLAGGAVPLALTAVGQDPAQSSSIILTTVTDVVGFFSFLGIATLLSGLL